MAGNPVSDPTIEATIAAALLDLERIGQRVRQVVESNVREYGMHLQNQVRINASTGVHQRGQPHILGTGPGPNVATGDYRRSITLEVSAEGVDNIAADVYTNSEQGARLEYGFVGVDSLGRVFSQSPFPHFHPAGDLIEPRFQAAVRDQVDAVLRSDGGPGV